VTDITIAPESFVDQEDRDRFGQCRHLENIGNINYDAQKFPTAIGYRQSGCLEQKLLDTNPNYEGKDKVLELMVQAKKHSGVKPRTPAKPLP
jgi:hypothetical protein